MEKLETIQILAKVGKVLSKIAFVFSIVGLVCSLIGLLGVMFLQDVMINNSEFANFMQTKGKTLGDLYAEITIAIVSCGVEIYVAYEAENYFKLQLEEKTPFTEKCSKNILRLGVIVLISGIATALLNAIIALIFAKTMGMSYEYSADMNGIGLGIAFLITSVIFGYGSHVLNENKNSEENQKENN